MVAVQFLLPRKGTETWLLVSLISPTYVTFNSSYPARGRKPTGLGPFTDEVSSSIPLTPQGDGNTNYLPRPATLHIGSIPLTPQGDGNYSALAIVSLDFQGSIPLTPQGDGNFGRLVGTQP